MFEDMNEKQARAQILASVRAYTEQFHNQRKSFEPGDRIAYASRVYGADEMEMLVDSSLDFWLTAGRYTDQFEAGFAQALQVKYCSVVNSGSSANLLAFMALTSPLLGERAVLRGDEVITVACGFPTTVTPILQYGAVPVFIDVTIPEYNVDITQLEAAVSCKTKAVMLAHTLGNPFDLKAVKAFCDKHSLWLIEDNCDALGAKFVLDGQEHFTGTIGDIGTSSFYPAHHITMGEGGAVYTNDPLLNKIIRSIRDWGRDCVCPSGVDNKCGQRFSKQYGELPLGYDHKYVYSHFGYNLKITEMQAAVGCAQLARLPDFVQRRNQHYALLRDAMQGLEEQLLLPKSCADAIPSWFGFPITCAPSVDKVALTRALEENGIQTRTLFAGNLLKHPCFDTLRATGEGYRVVGDLQGCDRVLHSTFWIGVYPGMTPDMLEHMACMIRKGLQA